MSLPRVSATSSLGTTILVSAVLFAATNLDGLLLLALFFGHRPFHRWRVVAGEFAGFSAIVVLALFGRLATWLISPQSIGLLGFVPIGLGLHQFWSARRTERPQADAAGVSAIRVAAVVFASGADNIAVYIPLFSSSSNGQLTAILGTFGGLVAVWCVAGAYLGRHRLLQASMARFGPRLAGAVLVILGIYILWSTDALGRWL